MGWPFSSCPQPGKASERNMVAGGEDRDRPGTGGGAPAGGGTRSSARADVPSTIPSPQARSHPRGRGPTREPPRNDWRERVGIEPTSDVISARHEDLKSLKSTRTHPFPRRSLAKGC